MRLALVNDLKTRVGDHSKDARCVNAYPDIINGEPSVKKRPAPVATGINIGANAQMLGTLLDAHVGIVFSSTGQFTDSESSGSISANNWTSSTKTTAANCLSVTPSVSMLSIRGVGDGTWYYRSVKWRVEYYDGSTWIPLSWRTITMGAQTSAPVTDSGTYNFPSAATWQWRLYAESFDTDGTIFGSPTYSYSQETVTAADVASGTLTPTTTQAYAINSSFNAPTGSGEIYQITYNATASATVQMASGTDNVGFRFSMGTGWTTGTYYDLSSDGNYNLVAAGAVLLATKKITALFVPITTTLQNWSPAAQSHTISGSNLTFNDKFWAVGCSRRGSASGTMNITMGLTSISATVYRRTLTSSNSTTPANTFTLSSYSWELSIGDGGDVLVDDATKALLSVVNDVLNVVDVSGI